MCLTPGRLLRATRTIAASPSIGGTSTFPLPGRIPQCVSSLKLCSILPRYGSTASPPVSTGARARRLLPWTSPRFSAGVGATQSLCSWTMRSTISCCPGAVPAIGPTMAGFIGQSTSSSPRRPLWSVLTSKRFLISQAMKASSPLPRMLFTSSRSWSGSASFQVWDEATGLVVLTNSETSRVFIAAGTVQTLILRAVLPHAKLWHFDHPNLYRLVFSIADEHETLSQPCLEYESSRLERMASST